MLTFTQHEERRQNRSEDIQTALGLQLSSTAERALFNSIVLADENGLVMAASGNSDLCEHIAAISPLLAGGMRTWHGSVDTNIGKVRLSVAPISVDGTMLYLSAVAGKRSAITEELFRSGLGIARILH